METNNRKNDQNIIPNDADKQQKGVNVPNLRFKEYCKNWTIEPMENVCKFFKGRGISKEDLSDTGNPCILYGELYTTYKTAIAKTIKSKTLLDLKSLVHSKPNDVLIPCSGETAEDISTSVCIPYDDVLIGGDLTIIRSQLNGAFLSNQINSVRKLDIAKIAQGKSIVHIQADELKKINISFPTIDEQLKIATFVDLLDQRIDTQSKIIEDLELFKKGIWNYIYLTKSSDWKCVKLSDILCERKDFALKGDEFIHATLSKDGIFAKTDRYDRDFLVTNDEKEYKITRLNDICYNPANLKFGVICLNKFGDAIFSPIYVTYIVKNDFIPSFVELILTSSRFLKYIRKYEQGTVYERMSVNSEDFLKGEILIPTKDKQKAIADYFDMLDLKIKKEKDILELYKKQKAYLLKNMFI